MDDKVEIDREKVMAVWIVLIRTPISRRDPVWEAAAKAVKESLDLDKVGIDKVGV